MNTLIKRQNPKYCAAFQPTHLHFIVPETSTLSLFPRMCWLLEKSGTILIPLLRVFWNLLTGLISLILFPIFFPASLCPSLHWWPLSSQISSDISELPMWNFLEIIFCANTQQESKLGCRHDVGHSVKLSSVDLGSNPDMSIQSGA